MGIQQRYRQKEQAASTLRHRQRVVVRRRLARWVLIDGHRRHDLLALKPPTNLLRRRHRDIQDVVRILPEQSGLIFPKRMTLPRSHFLHLTAHFPRGVILFERSSCGVVYRTKGKYVGTAKHLHVEQWCASMSRPVKVHSRVSVKSHAVFVSCSTLKLEDARQDVCDRITPSTRDTPHSVCVLSSH